MVMGGPWPLRREDGWKGGGKGDGWRVGGLRWTDNSDGNLVAGRSQFHGVGVGRWSWRVAVDVLG